MSWRTYFDPVADETLKDNYESQFGHADDISHFLGWVQHRNYYYTHNAWANFIDSLFPDTFPFSTAQTLLISVVAAVYSWGAQGMYNRGVEQGRKVIGKISETITWAQSEITNAVNDMRNRIDSEIVAPVRQKAAEIEETLKYAQMEVGRMGINIDRFSSTVENMKASISSFDGSIKAFDSKLGGFDSKLSGLNTTASGLQSQLRDAQGKLNQYKSLIDDVSRQVDNLENKQKEGFDFLKSIGWKTP